MNMIDDKISFYYYWVMNIFILHNFFPLLYYFNIMLQNINFDIFLFISYYFLIGIMDFHLKVCYFYFILNMIKIFKNEV